MPLWEIRVVAGLMEWETDQTSVVQKASVNSHMSLVGHHPFFNKMSTYLPKGLMALSCIWGSKNFAKPNLSTAAFKEHLWYRKKIEVQVPMPLKEEKWFFYSVATEQNHVYSHSFPGHIPFYVEQKKCFHFFRTARHKFQRQFISIHTGTIRHTGIPYLLRDSVDWHQKPCSRDTTSNPIQSPS